MVVYFFFIYFLNVISNISVNLSITIRLFFFKKVKINRTFLSILFYKGKDKNLRKQNQYIIYMKITIIY